MGKRAKWSWNRATDPQGIMNRPQFNKRRPKLPSMSEMRSGELQGSLEENLSRVESVAADTTPAKQAQRAAIDKHKHDARRRQRAASSIGAKGVLGFVKLNALRVHLRKLYAAEELP
eukprot:Hpha_TRINITY_DN15420_c0_g1::TRINITY_DN15420_c0_g1_i1::g.176887::m.176887